MALVDEIAVKLGVQTSDFKAALSDANASVKGFAEKGGASVDGLSSKLEHHLLSTRALAHALATSLGLNLENIAENIARFITGVSKEAEESWKKIGELSDQVTELAIKNMRSRLSEEQKLTLLKQEQARLQASLDGATLHNAKDIEDAGKRRLQLEKTTSEINEIEKKQSDDLKKKEDERYKSAVDGVEKERDGARALWEANLKTLGVSQQIAVLKGDIEVKEAAIRDHLFEGRDLEAAKNALARDREELTKLEADRKEKIAGDEKAQLEYLLLQDKVIRGIATGSEEQRLQVIKLQRKERANELELLDLAHKATVGKLTPAEEKRVAQLTKENEALDQSLASINAMSNLPPDVSPPVEATKKAAEQIVALLHTNYDDVTKETDRQLEEKRARLQSTIDANFLSTQINGYDDSITAQAKLSLSQVQDEIKTRANFRGEVSLFGEDNALLRHSAFDEERLRSYVEGTNAAKSTAASLDAIHSQFSKLFPGTAVAKNSGP